LVLLGHFDPILAKQLFSNTTISPSTLILLVVTPATVASCHSCAHRQLSFLRRQESITQLSFLRRQESTTLSRLLSDQRPQIQLSVATILVCQSEAH